MKRLGVLCITVLLFVLCFSCYELYGDKCSTEADATQPADDSTQATGPSAPKVIVNGSDSSVIPKIPPYAPQGSPNVDESGKVIIAPKSEPMVSRGVMGGIRSGGVTVGDPIIVNDMTPEQCCKKAEAQLSKCYNIEGNAVYRQCVSERSLGGGSFGAYADGLSGWSDGVSLYCEKVQAEFQTDCLYKFTQQCKGGCKVPQWVIDHANRVIIEAQHGRGSTGGGGGGKDSPKPIPAGEMPH